MSKHAKKGRTLDRRSMFEGWAAIGLVSRTVQNEFFVSFDFQKLSCSIAQYASTALVVQAAVKKRMMTREG